jgi:hypothetical protein
MLIQGPKCIMEGIVVNKKLEPGTREEKDS